MSRALFVVHAVVFLQVLCVGANFSTLKFYGNALGATGAAIGLLWMALTVPRALLSPIWGGLSDALGRRPLLIMSLIGASIGSVLWAIAPSYEILLLGRLMDGIFSATATLAFSVIADVVPANRRSAAMGAIGATVLTGFTLGPVGGALVASTWDYATLGWVMAGLQLAGVPLIWLLFRETAPARSLHHTVKQSVLSKFEGWGSVLRVPTMLAILVVMVLSAFGPAVYNTAFPNAAEHWFGWTERSVVIGFVLMAVVGGLIQGGAVRALAPRVGEVRLSAIGFAIMLVALAVLGTRAGVAAMMIGTVLLAIGGGLALPCVNALLANAAPAGREGLVMGLGQLSQGVARAGGLLLGSLFEGGRVGLPFWLAGGMTMLVWAFLGRMAPRPRTAAPPAERPPLP